ncbi:hypothetical protein [Tetragenococcus koreensis]|uniref:Uncharacterized protein n=1 Tax=Tetragenococcus koreensis TaxID=290335 RepID=A0AAN4UDU6_9ENTE|nr:hypothetical protein [Tetragenococcus koreensis]GEQ50608.1 hypothetical protein TK11N_24600 [Tetragenococcus koreensis]GEQ53119.1 hypothetical protein TK12N_24630 [Tetragenococcus koreensis]GEQ55622.1 hypothetical protein TK2N_24660 [Tetragenococcus koreensis]GEQ58119.1 hypothetical protein TK4N_24620 [Tetragenococcus koreensis]GEQ60622.1 hypothetical protein TK6N_24610 [Tetragenococcus koreensis]
MAFIGKKMSLVVYFDGDRHKQSTKVDIFIISDFLLTNTSELEQKHLMEVFELRKSSKPLILRSLNQRVVFQLLRKHPLLKALNKTFFESLEGKLSINLSEEFKHPKTYST